MGYRRYVEPSQPCINAPETGEPRRFMCDAEADLATVTSQQSPISGDQAWAALEKTSWVWDGAAWVASGSGGGVTNAQVMLRVILGT